MNFKEEIVSAHNLTKIVCSNPFVKSAVYSKISLRPLLVDGSKLFQAEKLTKTQAFHENIRCADLYQWLSANVEGQYKQICLLFENKTVTYLFSKSNFKRMENKTENKKLSQDFNRAKNYVLKEGENIPAFVDLGIFTSENKIVPSKQDKFKQINRFVELLDDVFKSYDKPQITILDFGCGKSYLTFFVYYYFVKIKGVNAKIIGYDLKADVVVHCNEIAQKYGYEDLHFVVADVSKDKLYDEHIDMVISLHACDTATDYALNYAVSKKAKYIFSVPCCQHEVNLSIRRGGSVNSTESCGDLDVLLKYGIIKERVSALLTDSIRAMLLEDEVYAVDVLEFVDLAHSPKNLMIRAKRTHEKSNKNLAVIEDLMQKYGFKQTLYQLLHGRN